jgi:hypothetical protein
VLRFGLAMTGRQIGFVGVRHHVGGDDVATKHQTYVGREHYVQRGHSDEDLFQPIHSSGIKASRQSAEQAALRNDCVTIRSQ